MGQVPSGCPSITRAADRAALLTWMARGLRRTRLRSDGEKKSDARCVRVQPCIQPARLTCCWPSRHRSGAARWLECAQCRVCGRTGTAWGHGGMGSRGRGTGWRSAAWLVWTGSDPALWRAGWWAFGLFWSRWARCFNFRAPPAAATFSAPYAAAHTLGSGQIGGVYFNKVAFKNPRGGAGRGPLPFLCPLWSRSPPVSRFHWGDLPSFSLRCPFRDQPATAKHRHLAPPDPLMALCTPSLQSNRAFSTRWLLVVLDRIDQHDISRLIGQAVSLVRLYSRQSQDG